jgi:COX assembly mitochondrial protein 1
MNSCMVAYATQKEQDAAREEWFATWDLRRLRLVEKEKHKKEQEKFHREWWGLPPVDDENQEKQAQDKRS